MSILSSTEYQRIERRKRASQRIMFFIFRLLSWTVVVILLAILGFIIKNGAGVLNWEFLTQPPSAGMTAGGIFPALVGTLYLVAGSMLFSLPLGILSGIYMNEYARNGHLIRFIRIMTNNLSGVPSVVFGIFGLALFVNWFGWGDSLLAGACTLGLLILPVIIRVTEEALKSIDNSYREGSRALGATKLQTIYRVLLPMAFPNIITGVILAIGRVAGETAPILFTAAAFYLPNLPNSIFDQVMALPYHLYVIAVSGSDLEATLPMAYGTALVLILLVLVLNLAANLIRRYFERKYEK
ncbi:MAG: phosphate ABC transporter permease PstA [Bacteroidales bacterium]